MLGEPAESAAASASRLLEAAAAGGWRGSDPYDGLWWPWPRIATAGPLRRQVIAQAHARAPIDLRRAYPGERPPIPKALGVFGNVGFGLARLRAGERPLALAADALAELDADRRAGERAWGYHWDVQTRWSFYPAGSPNVVVTAFCAPALAHAASALGEERYALRARDAALWTLETLYLEDEGIFAYHEGSRTLIHNASLLGARLVHTLAGGQGTPAVARAVERTLAAQRDDGSWPYGDGPRLGFVDSFHTGYVLDCLCDMLDVDPRVGEAVTRGAEYYTRSFFGPDGSARLWPDREYPLDAHAAGTGLTTIAKLIGHDRADEALLRKVTERTLSDVVDGEHAVFRRYRRWKTTVRYIRWCHAHVALGLVHAALALAGESRRS